MTLLRSIRYFSLFILAMLMVVSPVTGQDDAKKPKKKERVRMTLSYTNLNNNGSRLLAATKAKLDRSYTGVDNLKVKFYHDSVSQETYFGSMVTDEKGQANFPIPEVYRKPLKYDSSFFFIAEFEGDDEYRSASADIEIRNAISKLTFTEEDTTRYINFFVGVPTDSAKEYNPVVGVEASIYVKRLFGNLPISEELDETDDNGMLTIEFPADIRGDEDGNITVLGKVNDHFEFGNLQYTANLDWAMPVTDKDILSGRELWSAGANAPYSLVITVVVILVGVWGMIFYIIYQSYLIKKLGTMSTD